MPKSTGSRIRDTETLTPDREALEHPHILFTLQRDPLLVAMTAHGLDEPERHTPTAARKSASGHGGRGRGR